MAKVLIVADDEIQRTNLITLFKNEGHECLEAENGARALGLLLTRHIEVVIADLDLPVISGIQLLGYMAEYDLIHRTVVIVMTEELKPNVNEMVHAAGVYAIVKKPLEFSDLLPMVALAQRDSAFSSTSRNFQ